MLCTAPTVRGWSLWSLSLCLVLSPSSLRRPLHLGKSNKVLQHRQCHSSYTQKPCPAENNPPSALPSQGKMVPAQVPVQVWIPEVMLLALASDQLLPCYLWMWWRDPWCRRRWWQCGRRRRCWRGRRRCWTMNWPVLFNQCVNPLTSLRRVVLVPHIPHCIVPT